MLNKRFARLVLLLALLSLVVAACGGASANTDQDGDSAVEAGQDAETATDDDHDDEAEGDDHADEAEGDDHADEAEGDDHADDGDDHDEEFSFGSPGDPAEADRVIEVDANDDFTFGPTEITVSAGETITFVVTNTGVLPHDFTLGDEATQDKHEEEMAEMAGSDSLGGHDDPNAVVVLAGETKELTWTFTEEGTVLTGCHQPGHYAAGMEGAVEVGS